MISIKSTFFFILIILVCCPAIAGAQNSLLKNSVGMGLSVLPSTMGARALFVIGEYERFLNPKISIGARPQFILYQHMLKSTAQTRTRSGTGFSSGIVIKRYFSTNLQKGFYIAPAVDIAIMEDTYSISNDYGSETGGTSAFAVCPNLMLGFRFNISRKISISPTCQIGYRYNVYSLFSRIPDILAGQPTGLRLDTSNFYESGPYGSIGFRVFYGF